MINASRSATLYEGTTGQVLRCVVTPDNAGVNTITSVTRDITGGANRDTTSDTVSDGVISVEEAIQVLSLSDTGTYTCSATVTSEPNNMYIMSATNTDTLSITVEGTCVCVCACVCVCVCVRACVRACVHGSIYLTVL